MYYSYVLRDSKGRLYKGCTNNLKRRLAEHRRGATQSTKSMSDVQLVYFETFATFAEARAREVYFKTAAGRRYLSGKIADNSGNF